MTDRIDETPRIKERDEPVACASCGRPTLAASGLCPSCQKLPPPPVIPPLLPGDPGDEPPPLPDLDDAGNINEDVHCRQCGYNLRGLAMIAGAVCPECELPIARSIFGDQLRYADPIWLKRIDFGTRLLLAGILIGLVIGIVIAGIIGGMTLRAGGAMPVAAIAVQTVTDVLVVLVWVIAIWFMTTPDPGASELEKPINARTVTRWCALAMLFAAPLGVLIQEHWIIGAAPTMSLANIVVLASGMALELVSLIGIAAGFIYVRSLALRIPDDGLAKQTKFVGWGYVIASGLGQMLGYAVAIGFMIGGMNVAGGPGIFVFAIGSCSVGLISLIFGIWALVLLFRYAKAFRAAREHAEQFTGADAITAVSPAMPVKSEDR